MFKVLIFFFFFKDKLYFPSLAVRELSVHMATPRRLPSPLHSTAGVDWEYLRNSSLLNLRLILLSVPTLLPSPPQPEGLG